MATTAVGTGADPWYRDEARGLYVLDFDTWKCAREIGRLTKDADFNKRLTKKWTLTEMPEGLAERLREMAGEYGRTRPERGYGGRSRSFAAASEDVPSPFLEALEEGKREHAQRASSRTSSPVPSPRSRPETPTASPASKRQRTAPASVVAPRSKAFVDLSVDDDDPAPVARSVPTTPKTPSPARRDAAADSISEGDDDDDLDETGRFRPPMYYLQRVANRDPTGYTRATLVHDELRRRKREGVRTDCMECDSAATCFACRSACCPQARRIVSSNRVGIFCSVHRTVRFASDEKTVIQNIALINKHNGAEVAEEIESDDDDVPIAAPPATSEWHSEDDIVFLD
jgi:hypothetical protein